VYVYTISKSWLVGNYLLLRDFGPYGIIFMNVCVVITVAMVMQLKGFQPYGIIYCCVCPVLEIFATFFMVFTSIYTIILVYLYLKALEMLSVSVTSTIEI
jgi:hypothetical protein